MHPAVSAVKFEAESDVARLKRELLRPETSCGCFQTSVHLAAKAITCGHQPCSRLDVIACLYCHIDGSGSVLSVQIASEVIGHVVRGRNDS